MIIQSVTLRLFVFMFVVQQMLCWSPSVRIFKFDRLIMDIFKTPKIENKEKLLNTINKFIQVITNTTKELKDLNEDVFNMSKPIYDKGWPDFICYSMQYPELHDMRVIFKWTIGQMKDFKSLLHRCMFVWVKFLEAYFDNLDDDIPTDAPI